MIGRFVFGFEERRKAVAVRLEADGPNRVPTPQEQEAGDKRLHLTSQTKHKPNAVQFQRFAGLHRSRSGDWQLRCSRLATKVRCSHPRVTAPAAERASQVRGKYCHIQRRLCSDRIVQCYTVLERFQNNLLLLGCPGGSAKRWARVGFYGMGSKRRWWASDPARSALQEGAGSITPGGD
jgi:hypothetical protein